MGDVNSDGSADLFWNATSTGTNHLYVGIGSRNAVFGLGGRQAVGAAGWAAYSTRVGDVNGDGNSDLIWIETAPVNRVRSVLGGSGGFDLATLRSQDSQLGRDDWATPDILVGDVDYNGRADLIYNQRGTTNYVAVLLGKIDGSFDDSRVAQTHPVETDWAQFQVHELDINGDGRDDIVWSDHGGANRLFVALAKRP